MNVGDIYKSVQGVNVEVLEYINSSKVRVRRLSDDLEFSVTSANLRKGAFSGYKARAASSTYTLLDNERWIPGYQGYYTVSDDGEIWSVRTGNRIPLKGGNVYDKNRQTDAYRVFCVSISGVSKSLNHHRVVAEAFIPNPENKPVVNHIDGNKLNNAVTNLEWATYSENVQHAIDTGLLRYGTKYEAGEFDSAILESMQCGYLKGLTMGRWAGVPDSTLERLGVNIPAWRSLPAKASTKRRNDYTPDKIRKLLETQTMTSLAAEMGVSVSAVSRRLSRSKQ